MDDLTFSSYNARGLRQLKKRRVLFSFLHRNHFDITLIQETHSCMDDGKIWQSEWGGRIFYSHGSNSSCGVCVLFKPNLNYKVLKTHLHPHGRYIVMDFQVSDMVVTLVCIYGPNRDNPHFSRACKTFYRIFIVIRLYGPAITILYLTSN
ncbi:hypothetical protein HOLleu_27726 [Holothuria leucospilota]|uniref:exodeoxyribonuclease III n=1 Tax=Holothuria leucospilota TaxID=206669 RepID=A0A9Q1H3F9_HOLLE|nr:hypothetical protein HOLleu_27726 [Holothuria leucospilota]